MFSVINSDISRSSLYEICQVIMNLTYIAYDRKNDNLFFNKEDSFLSENSNNVNLLLMADKDKIFKGDCNSVDDIFAFLINNNSSDNDNSEFFSIFKNLEILIKI